METFDINFEYADIAFQATVTEVRTGNELSFIINFDASQTELTKLLGYRDLIANPSMHYDPLTGELVFKALTGWQDLEQILSQAIQAHYA